MKLEDLTVTLHRISGEEIDEHTECLVTMLSHSAVMLNAPHSELSKKIVVDSIDSFILCTHTHAYSSMFDRWLNSLSVYTSNKSRTGLIS